MSNFVSDRLIAVAACLCQQIRDDGLPEPDWCGVLPGEAPFPVYLGEDCSTQAWVRLGTAYPSDGFAGDQQQQQPGNCTSGLGIDVEIGILRCFPMPEDGAGPSESEIADAFDLQTSDMLTMWRAVNCCTDLPNSEFILTGYTPIGPQGGLIGGSWGIRLVM